MSTEDVTRKQGTPSCIEGDIPYFFIVARALLADFLRPLEHSRVDYLQFRNNWRAGLSAPQDAHVGHIVEYAPDSARMPVFTLAISGADFTQIVGNPLWAVSLVDILVEYEPDNPGFFLVNFKVI